VTNYAHVTLVVDPMFGRRAIKQAELGPLWVVDSPENTPVIKEIWAAGSARFADSPTFLTGYSDHTREETAIICVGTVHDHHPLWQAFEIIGTPVSPSLLNALKECANGSTRKTSDGFIFDRASEN
jgi:hypothetical protein